MCWPPSRPPATIGLGPDDVLHDDRHRRRRDVPVRDRSDHRTRPSRAASADIEAEAAAGRYLTDGDTGDFLELGDVGRRRIFNLGYYTWVEQQGVPFADFEQRRDQAFWKSLRPHLDIWDAMIIDFNERSRCHGI